MTIITSYSHKPIEENQIRLLKFVEDESSSSIHAVLEPFSIKEPLPKFRSISYAWACDESGLARNRGIRIDGQGLYVLDSLYTFLEALKSKRTMYDGGWWWIDSVCIDQGNLEERASQVEHLQQIYRAAEQVIVWLGEESHDSDLAIDFIKILDRYSREKHSVEELRSELEIEKYHGEWKALEYFLARRWWSRMWTVQEFVLPRSISFWCGMRSIGRVSICRALAVANRCTTIGIKETAGFTNGLNRRRVWGLYKAGKPGENVTLSLSALTSYFSSMDATDDRDRLYGLMALASDASLMDVNYFLPSQEIYLRFAQSFITHYKSLDIISFASIYSSPSSSSQPSWVPYWQKKTPLVIPLMVSQSCRSHIGNLRTPHALEYDHSIGYSASKKRAAVYSFEGSNLLARGVVVDVVDGLAGNKKFELVQSSEWSSTQLSPPNNFSATEILVSVCRCIALDRKDRYLRYAMPSKDFFQDFVRLLEQLLTESQSAFLSSPAQELQEWFEWTRSLQIHGRSFKTILRDSLDQDQVDIYRDPTNPAPNQDEYYHDTFFGRFFDTVVRLSLRLMVSRNGRIGMVQEKAMKGDLICVLFGCNVPVLLRNSESGDGVTFVGECFLDGCMDGSVLDDHGLLEKTFCIR
ncbi:hypothetical protein PENSTE_c017G02689 [Penicillium steckii]|uniref:Heterokaryon incompatibility domain-containing protein n=1 Tax=Penicillium steckii TaxID=303698 RepID=A0A1V6SYB7_9EURO|nr:hypothetical protein PENSTE_c017G02689 [Penicillium steckii]